MIKDYSSINWKNCEAVVLRLQFKISEAWIRSDLKKVSSLQRILVNSFAARALAVKKVCGNSDTPGIDNVVWLEDTTKMDIILTKLKGKYDASPVKRVFIPKKNSSKMRPLGIPTMLDRAKQAMHAMALAPIAECTADRFSYGFRPYRSTQDARVKLEYTLEDLVTSKEIWILDADIKGFFDHISHDWMIKNIPMDKKILTKWLKSGALEFKKFKDTDSGVPQGGIISPIIANMVLDGLEKEIKTQLTKRRKLIGITTLIRYADDFIILSKQDWMIKEYIIPIIKEFLQVRGLTLNIEKTKVINIKKESLDFLGFNFSYREGNLTVTPTKKSIDNIQNRIREEIELAHNYSNEDLINKLNPIIRGWANYYIGCYTARASLIKVGKYIWDAVYKWVSDKNQNRQKRQVLRENFKEKGNYKFVLTSTENKKKTLYNIAEIWTKPHRLTKNINCYLKENRDYFTSLK